MNLDKINPYLSDLQSDHLYHLGLSTDMDIATIFSGIKYVVFTSFNEDAALIAGEFAKSWYQIKTDAIMCKAIYKTERYNLYKVGPIIVVSHGFGMPSLLICLNEITKLMLYLGYNEVVFFKIARASNIKSMLTNISAHDVSQDVVIIDEVLDSKLQAYYTTIECGAQYQHHTRLDSELISDLCTFRQDKYQEFVKDQQEITPTLSIAKGMGIYNFYEEQATSTDIISSHGYSQDMFDEYWQHALDIGVRSIDTESLAFAGFCNHLGIRACCLNLCVSLPIMMNMYSMNSNKNDNTFSNHVVHLLISYIAYKLAVNGVINAR